MHACTHACIHTCMHTCIHAYMHTCMHAYMHTCIHAHMHKHIYTAQGKRDKTPEFGLAVGWLRVLNPCLTASLSPALPVTLLLCLVLHLLAHLVHTPWKRSLLQSVPLPGCPGCMPCCHQSPTNVPRLLAGVHAQKAPLLSSPT